MKALTLLLCFADLVISIALIAPDIMVMFINASLFVLSAPFRKLFTRFSTFSQAVVCFSCIINGNLFWQNDAVETTAVTKTAVSGRWIHCCRLDQAFPICFVFPDLFSWHLQYFISYQAKIPRDSALIHRRNSYTPLSSHDQVKRPRLYSAGNQPWLPLAPTPSALMPEGRQSQVSARVTGSPPLHNKPLSTAISHLPPQLYPTWHSPASAFDCW